MSSQSPFSPCPAPFKPALLLIDLQVDFNAGYTDPSGLCTDPPGALAVANAPSAISPILSLLSLPFPLKVFTKDSHPENHISFASNHPPPNNQPFTSFTTITHPDDPSKSFTTRLWPVHCVTDTPGWHFISPIKDWLDKNIFSDPAEITIIRKGQDPRIEMYSAFEDPFGNAPGGQPSLESVLHKHNITDVYVVGLAGDYCVKETVSHSGIKGFRTWVVREGVASVDEGDSGWGEAKKAMEAAGGGGLVKIVGIEGVEVGWVRELSAGIA